MLATTTLNQLEKNLEKFFDQDWIRKVSRKLRSAVIDNSNLQFDLLEPNGIEFKARTIKEKILLGIFQWFTEPELRCLINLWLEENWGGESKEIMKIINNSKDTALGYLLVSNKWNDRDFFGNFLKNENFYFFNWSRIRQRNHSAPRRKMRRRGYDDKGTLPSKTNPEPIFDYRKILSVQEQMNREVKQQQIYSLLLEQVWERLILESVS